MSDTHAYLPSDKILNASVKLLAEIEAHRAVIYEESIEKARNRGFGLPKRSVKSAIKLVNISDDGWQQEDIALGLANLAKAAVELDSTSRIYVSRSDFDIIKRHWPWRKEETVE